MKSSAQILAAAQSALRAANGFVAAGVLADGAQAMRLHFIERARSGLELQISASGKTAEIVDWKAQVGPKAAVDAIPAVVVHQAGNVPGGTSGTLAVATRGPAYPLRVTEFGPTRPGGKVDACNNGQGDDTVGSLTTLSDSTTPPPSRHPLIP